MDFPDGLFRAEMAVMGFHDGLQSQRWTIQSNLGIITGMRAKDDYQAKIRLWAANPQVVALPVFPALPKFPPQKFRTHLEMNEWKKQLLLQLARKLD